MKGLARREDAFISGVIIALAYIDAPVKHFIIDSLVAPPTCPPAGATPRGLARAVVRRGGGRDVSSMLDMAKSI